MIFKTYGPKGVFYKLSTKCFKIDRFEYSFEVCPYKKTIQQKKNGQVCKLKGMKTGSVFFYNIFILVRDHKPTLDFLRFS